MKPEVKVIILGVSFNDAFGAGITLRNLFSQFTPEQIAVVDYNVAPEDLKYCACLFHLGKNTLINSKNYTWDEKHLSVSPSKRRNDKKFPNFTREFLLMLRKHLAYYYNHYTTINITSELTAFINQFNPDFIYVVPYNRRIINFAINISRINKIPIVVHFMDDYRKRSPWDPLYFYNEFRHSKKIRQLVNNSDKCLAICESMALEYTKIFNRPFQYFHNPINVKAFINFENKRIEKEKHIIRIAYTGTISENNFDALVFFTKYCSIQKLDDYKIYLDIYSPEVNTNIFYQRFSNIIKRNKYVHMRNKLDHSQLITELFTYNFLLLPLTFSKRYHHVIKVSFPTKAAEYMASGIPVIFLIPRSIALYEFVNRHKIGHIVDELKKEQLNIFFRKKINNNELDLIDDKAKSLAFNMFDIEKVAVEFKQVFT